MFIAHLPAGYILTHILQYKHHRSDYLWLGLLASVLPDFDLLYFYLIDNRQNAHHTYFPHLPLFWFGLWAATVLIGKWSGKYSVYPVTLFFSCIMLHMCLDSIAAPLYWFYPLSDIAVELVTVPARFDWWVWNYLFHWSFLLEIVIILIALCIFIRKKISCLRKS